MSKWAHINGMITVVPFGRTQHEKRYILETVLDHLPQVTGSERNMNIHIVQKAGYSGWSSHDELGVLGEYSTVRNKEEHFDNILTQSEYILVLEGDLRDKEFSETFGEFNKFLNRLAKRVEVTQLLVEIKEGENKYTFSNSAPYNEMYEIPSWCNKNDEEAWWEYLAWREV